MISFYACLQQIAFHRAQSQRQQGVSMRAYHRGMVLHYIGNARARQHHDAIVSGNTALADKLAVKLTAYNNRTIAAALKA